MPEARDIIYVLRDNSTLRTVPVDPELARKLTREGRKAREATAERDRLIAEAYKAGGGLREIARLVGLTHPTVKYIVGRAESQ